MVGITVAGALCAGAYGALHDQVSYTIGPEYFTKLKFDQFASADFGWPRRVFAAEVGFLATWWVGLIGGWVLARVGLAELAEVTGPSSVIRAFALLAGVAALVGCAGALLGMVATLDDLSAWAEWREELGLRDLRAFVIVAYLHTASYLGAVLGLACAVTFVRRRLARARLVAAAEPCEVLR
jgi:hypothetical protein